MRRFKGRLLVVVLAPGNHLRKVADKHLRGQTAVNTGSMVERAEKMEERVRRCAHSPGC
jgi:hypothetical protein